MMPNERKEYTPDQRWASGIKNWKLAMIQLQLAKLALAVRDAGGSGDIDFIKNQTIEDFLNRMIPNGVGLGPITVVVPK